MELQGGGGALKKGIGVRGAINRQEVRGGVLKRGVGQLGFLKPYSVIFVYKTKEVWSTAFHTGFLLGGENFSA